MAKDNKERVYWIRKMSNTVIPSKDELRDLFSLSNNIPFDDRVNHFAELTDLNITLIQSYLKEIGSSLYDDSKTVDFADLCMRMQIVGSLPEYIKPKNVGLMFFSFEPEKFFPYAQIDVVEFPENLGGDRIVEKIFKGPLHIQLREAMLYIKNNIIQEEIIKLPNAPEARRFFNYPEAAIEEALANAVYHKGYDEREPIEVRILPECIQIVSHPGADRSVTIEGLKNLKVYNRRYRNRRIGDFLKELHLTEGRNTGFGKIASALEYNGSPPPLFETDDERLSFVTIISKHPEFIGGSTNVLKNVPDNVLKNVPDNVQLNKRKTRQEHIVKILQENGNLTADSLAISLNVSRKTIQRDLTFLKEKGQIKRSGSSINGHWVVQNTQ